MKIGLIRGTFDPFTTNDLELALDYLRNKGFSKIYFELTEGENYQQRLEILKRTIKPYNRLKIGSKGELIEDERFSLGLTNNNLLDISNRSIDYILTNCLYIDKIVQQSLSEHRYNHVKCVANLAAQLALRYGYSFHQGYLAGYLHDITKEWPKDYQLEFIKIYRPDKIDLSNKIHHQYSAEIYVKKYFKIKDNDILKAIGNHCNGTDRSILSKIIFCVDKIDDSRGFDNSKIKDLLFRDINQAYKQIKEEQINYLKEQNIELFKDNMSNIK